MDEWKEYKISEVIDEISMGPFGSNIKVDNFIDSGVPVLNGSNLQGFKLNENSFNYVSQEKADSLGKANAHRGDVVITHRGTLGQIVYIPDDSKFEQYVISQSQFRLKLKKDFIRPDFFAYFFHTRLGQHRILMNASQVGVPALARPTSTFKDVCIPVPPMEKQNKVMDILHSLDDKIEVNRRINDNLEHQAQALFKSWFVDFEPFKNGEFVESELGMIPKGWRVGTLGEIADINPSRALKKGDDATYLDMKNMPTSGPFPMCCESKVYTGGMRFQNKDILMARITPCLENGKVAYVNFLEDKEIAFGSTEYIVMTSKNGFFPELLYFLCRDEDFKGYATKNMNGSSGRQRVSGETIGNYKIAIPPKALIESIASFYKGIMDNIKNNGFESRRLAELRDTLLPKLMSGELKVSDIH